MPLISWPTSRSPKHRREDFDRQIHSGYSSQSSSTVINGYSLSSGLPANISGNGSSSLVTLVVVIDRIVGTVSFHIPRVSPLPPCSTLLPPRPQCLTSRAHQLSRFHQPQYHWPAYDQAPVLYDAAQLYPLFMHWAQMLLYASRAYDTVVEEPVVSFCNSTIL